MIGIKIVNLFDNHIVKILGIGESERFMYLALYQGIPKVDTQYLLSKDNDQVMNQTADEIHNHLHVDPTLLCTSFLSRRFYCFTKREPNEINESRDQLNEKPTEVELINQMISLPKAIGKEVLIHTTFGDIEIKLFSNECPRTVENFCVS